MNCWQVQCWYLLLPVIRLFPQSPFLPILKLVPLPFSFAFVREANQLLPAWFPNAASLIGHKLAAWYSKPLHWTPWFLDADIQTCRLVVNRISYTVSHNLLLQFMTMKCHISRGHYSCKSLWDSASFPEKNVSLSHKVWLYIAIFVFWVTSVVGP